MMNTALGKPTLTAVAQVSREFKARDRRAMHAKQVFNARIERAQSDYAETMRLIWTTNAETQETPDSQVN